MSRAARLGLVLGPFVGLFAGVVLTLGLADDIATAWDEVETVREHLSVREFADRQEQLELQVDGLLANLRYIRSLPPTRVVTTDTIIREGPPRSFTVTMRGSPTEITLNRLTTIEDSIGPGFIPTLESFDISRCEEWSLGATPEELRCNLNRIGRFGVMTDLAVLFDADGAEPLATVAAYWQRHRSSNLWVYAGARSDAAFVIGALIRKNLLAL